ncbi:hypothetical protein [Roseobacter cerasinus]|uniref:hypothetical protein n=1 Tax=Roseobacter cerasinus TaxID=2602289 RepID=UPI001EEA5A9F|nr:hypothetical protein [Roseobacter cerasinus]
MLTFTGCSSANLFADGHIARPASFIRPEVAPLEFGVTDDDGACLDLTEEDFLFQ